MANIAGATNISPAVVSVVTTKSRGVSVPGGLRLAAIMGEGLREETITSAALGGGKDGLDPTYSSATGADGRHFLLTYVPVISNRTTLYKNGIPLVGLEQANFWRSSSVFSNLYDYRMDITTGRIELQTAAFVDQGGANYLPSALNVGNGTINGLTLVDSNAPTETWSIRCISIRRDGGGNPVDGYARFIAQGSESGILQDSYGNNYVWQSSGATVSNTIISFSITEGAVAFHEGDVFTIEVKSGALSTGDSLVASYIGVSDLNDPEFFTDPEDVRIKHGSASITNRLSLGSQLAFANSPPGIWACQTAPSVPRRVSYELEASATGSAAIDDLTFDLPIGVTPDTDSNVNFFVTDPITGLETQLIPNKTAFYDSAITANPSLFVFGAYVYSYTVILDTNKEVVKHAEDGVLTSVSGTHATLSSASITFGQDDVSATRRVHIKTPAVSAGTYTVVSVTGGVVTIYNAAGFTSGSSIRFEVLETSESSAKVLFTKDLALAVGQSLRCTAVDIKDADFFDVGWQAGYEALEAIECDMVVPLPSQTISAIFQAGRIHVETMSNIRNKKERIELIGAIKGLTPDNVIGTTPAAVEDIGILEGIQGDTVAEILAGNVEDLADYGVQNSYGTTFRVVYLYPDEIIVQVGSSNVSLDGFFMAPAVAGYLSGVPNINIPLTNKTVTGFSILRNKLYRPIIVDNLVNAGICLLQPATGGGNVIWGKTTTASGAAEEEEISVVFIRDRMSKSLRQGFRGFIGGPEEDQFVGTLLSRTHKIFQGFMSQRLITTYRNVRVQRDAVEPRQWNISAEAQPVYPVNWIYVSVSVGLLE